MFAHSFQTALRYARRAPLLTLLSVSTLAVGLVCFLLAYAIVAFWNGADKQWANSARTYVISTTMRMRGTNISVDGAPISNEYIAQYLKTDFPRLAAVARAVGVHDNPARQVAHESGLTLAAGDRVTRVRAIGVDPEFLKIFNLPIIGTHARLALLQPRSILLDRRTAERLFGDANAVGRSLTVGGSAVDVTVRGVIGDIPEPSQMGRSFRAPLRFDAIVGWDVYQTLLKNELGFVMPENWIRGYAVTYALLPRNGSLTAGELQRQLGAFVKRHMPPAQAKLARLELGLVPVSKILGMSLNFGGISMQALLLGLGGLVLLVACVNFAALSSGRGAARARHVGIQKVIGAKRGHLIRQYLVEAGLLTSGALLIALIAVCLLIPVVQSRLGIDVRIPLLNGAGFLILVLSVAVAVTVVAGAYPALVLSRVAPVSVLRGAPPHLGATFLSKVLVGVQFAATSFLLFAVIVTYLQNRELRVIGGRTDGQRLLVIENSVRETHLMPATLRTQLLQLPGVDAVTAMDPPPWSGGGGLLQIASSPESAAPARTALLYSVEQDFFSALNIPVLAGRSFDRERDNRFAKRNGNGMPTLIIDRSLSKQLGFDSPDRAIGETVYVRSQNGASSGAGRGKPWLVVGVVADRSLAVASPLGKRASAYQFYPAAFMTSNVVRLSKGSVAVTVAAIDRLWRKLVPGVPINRRFVDQNFDASFRAYAVFDRAFALLALLALTISATGLFAMASMAVNRRIREVGVRKVLGATRGRILALLLGSLGLPVVIGNVLAWPVAYFAGLTYLSRFLNPIALTATPFAACLLLTLLVAGIVVIGQTWRAARIKPARVLRAE